MMFAEYIDTKWYLAFSSGNRNFKLTSLHNLAQLHIIREFNENSGIYSDKKFWILCWCSMLVVLSWGIKESITMVWRRNRKILNEILLKIIFLSPTLWGSRNNDDISCQIIWILLSLITNQAWFCLTLSLSSVTLFTPAPIKGNVLCVLDFFTLSRWSAQYFIETYIEWSGQQRPAFSLSGRISESWIML